MKTLNTQHSGLCMRRASLHLTKLITSPAFAINNGALPARQQLATCWVPPVLNLHSWRALSPAATVSKMSMELPAAKRARLEPVSVADTEEAVAAPASEAAPDAAAGSISPLAAGSRRRIRRSRSRSPVLMGNGTSAAAYTTSAAPAAPLEPAIVDKDYFTVTEAAAIGDAVLGQASLNTVPPVATQAAAAAAGPAVQQAKQQQPVVIADASPSVSHRADGQEHQQQHQQQQQQPHQQPANGQQQQPAQDQKQPDQQQQQQQGQKLSKQKRKQQSPVFQLQTAIHQCIKMDRPHEAFYLYQKIKEVEPSHKMDTGTVSALLNLVVGKWRWELQQRYQHLLKQYEAAGQDTAPLAAAYDACVAAAVHEKEQQSKETGDQYMRVSGAHPDGAPAALKCHVEKQIELTDEAKLQSERERVQALLEGMSPDRLSLPELLQSSVSVALADLQACGQTWDELIYLQLARVAAVSGDYDKAYDYAKQLVAAWQASNKNSKLLPRLRDFQPALVGYALTGQADKAEEIMDIMTQTCGLDLTESEFGLWFEAIANGGTYNQMAAALRAAGGELNHLRRSTVDMVEQFFCSDRAAAAGPLTALSKQRWQQQWVKVDDLGHVAEAGVQLQLADLSAEDWQSFGSQVQSLAVKQEKKQGRFEDFVKWLQRNGPYDMMIDGANVALWGENYEGGGFKPEKIRVMYETLAKQNPDAKMLLVLHSGRFGMIRQEHKEVYQWLEQIRASANFTVVPAGSNDDWYWMYAAVMARERGMLVSNDLLRDHVWNLVRPKHMLKWTQRHIIRFSFNFEKTEAYLQYPLPYTPCVQYNEDKGVWMVPCADRDGQWLCVKAV